MQTSLSAKDSRPDSVARRSGGHDLKWQDWRREKAMSWPKSFWTISDVPEVIGTHQQVTENQILDQEVDRLAHRTNFQHGRSMGRLAEDPNECKSYVDIAFFGDSCNETLFKRGFSEEVTKDQNEVEGAVTEKNSGYRRTRGGLRDLIRLHEEEIARASGSKQVFAKRPKHEEMQQCITPCSPEDEGRINHRKEASDVTAVNHRTSASHDNSFMQNQEVLFSVNSPSVSNVICNVEADIAQRSDRSTTTEDIEFHLQEDIAKSFEGKIMEKEEIISNLIREKEKLLVKLEEQRKVANAYQKLEDRYRRRVYDLEKVMLSCTCGGLDSGSASEQDLAKSFTTRFETRKSSSHPELQQPKKVDNIINELETWMMDQKGIQNLHDNSSDTQDFMASESSLSSLSDVRLSSFPFEFIDQFDATSV